MTEKTYVKQVGTWYNRSKYAAYLLFAGGALTGVAGKFTNSEMLMGVGSALLLTTWMYLIGTHRAEDQFIEQKSGLEDKLKD